MSLLRTCCGSGIFCSFVGYRSIFGPMLDHDAQAGADAYLTRPVESPVLLATVRTLLFARRAEGTVSKL